MRVIYIVFFFFSFQSLFSQTPKQPSRVDSARLEMDKMIRDATSDYYVVVAGMSSDYIVLRQEAQQLSNQTRIPYEDEKLIYDKKLGLVWPADSSAGDDIYAGSYFMRRYGEDSAGVNFISLEMRDWYFNVPVNQRSLRMILVAGLFGDKAEAEKRLKEVQKFKPAAYLRKAPIYMGCIH